MPRPFAKYEGLGNDFIVLDARDWPRDELTAALAKQLCDRHEGVGADGVLWLGPRDALVILNADGSRPEMCGNGVRCVAGFLHDRGRLATGTSVSLATDAGIRTATLLHDRGSYVQVEVDMGPVRVAPDDVRVGDTSAIAVDVGNPHAVLFDVPAGSDEASMVSAVEANTRVWPQGVNVEFVSRRAEGGFAVRVHERGVGWTRACGTGACAVVAAAVVRERNVRIGERVPVALPGGLLEVRIEADGDGLRARMTGPARRVFTGDVEIDGRARA